MFDGLCNQSILAQCQAAGRRGRPKKNRLREMIRNAGLVQQTTAWLSGSAGIVNNEYSTQRHPVRQVTDDQINQL
jgi:hypothetical protein